MTYYSSAPPFCTGVTNRWVAYTTAGGDVLWETSVIAVVNATACLASVVIWAGFGAGIGRFLGDPRARIAFNWSMAALLVISLIPVIR